MTAIGPRSILLVNVHSLRNAGDAVLALQAVRSLRQAFPQADITLSMNEPQDLSAWVGQVSGPLPHSLGSFFFQCRQGQSWNLIKLLEMVFFSAIVLFGSKFGSRNPDGDRVSPHLPIAWRPLFEAYWRADLVCSAPGNFLYSSGRLGLPLWFHLFSMSFAHWLGKPVYGLPQSFGPFRRAWEGKLCAAVLRRNRLVLAREPLSLRWLGQLGLKPPQCRMTPDLAFAFQGETSDVGKQWLQNQGVDSESNRPRLGLTLVNWERIMSSFQQQAAYEQALHIAVRSWLTLTGGQAILFPQVVGLQSGEDDRPPSSRLAEALADLGEQVVMIRESAAPGVLQAAYGQMDIFLGTRMHSNIFALKRAVPVLAIAYQPKTQGLMQSVGLQEWVLDIQRLDGDALSLRLIDLWQRRHELREQIAPQIAGLAAQAEEVADLLRQDWERLHD